MGSKAMTWALVALIALATPMGAAPPPEAACPGFQVVPDLGPSCPEQGGWRVLLPNGGSVFTHGPDPPPPPREGVDAPPALAPLCVGESEHRNHLIYAHPLDRPSRYAQLAPTLRNLVAQANGMLRSESAELGYRSDFLFLCDDGVVRVENEPLLMLTFTGNFGAIVGQLQGRGYTDTNAKYWIWYDGPSNSGAAGIGTVINDDRGSAANNNNGGPSYGVTFDFLDWGVMMHENGHNLGAVQRSAPDQSGGWHCNDGRDVMCYSDGGSNSTYNPNVCAREHYDCDHDSYFHPNPPPGTYLATKWNIGAPYVRYLRTVPLVPESDPPSTSALLEGTSATPGWYAGDVRVTLQASDASDFTETRYRVDGGAWTVYAGAFFVRNDGPHAVDYYSVDGWGNTEATKTSSFRIDTVAPTLLNLRPNGCVYDAAGACASTSLSGQAFAAGLPSLAVVSTASDNHGLVRVQAFAGAQGTLLACDAGTQLGGTFTCTWDRAPEQRSFNRLRVVARDQAGNEATVMVNVAG